MFRAKISSKSKLRKVNKGRVEKRGTFWKMEDEKLHHGEVELD
jgi:hypothetical protein